MQLFVCVYVCGGVFSNMHAYHSMPIEISLSKSVLPSTVWVQKTVLRSSSFVASTFTHQIILLAPVWSCVHVHVCAGICMYAGACAHVCVMSRPEDLDIIPKALFSWFLETESFTGLEPSK